MITINNCDSQSVQHRKEIDSPKWLILCVMVHVVRNVAFTPRDIASELFSERHSLEISSNS